MMKLLLGLGRVVRDDVVVDVQVVVLDVRRQRLQRVLEDDLEACAEDQIEAWGGVADSDELSRGERRRRD